MRRFVGLFILITFPIGTTLAATTKAKAKAKAKRVQFTDTLSLLSKLATNPNAITQGASPPGTVLLSATSNAANDVASLGLGGLGGDTATVGSDAAADEVSDSIRSLFNLPDQTAQLTQPSPAKSSVPPRVKTQLLDTSVEAPHEPVKDPVKAPVTQLAAKTSEQSLKPTITKPATKTPQQLPKATATAPLAKTTQRAKEIKKATPKQSAKVVQKAVVKPPSASKPKAETHSVVSATKASHLYQETPKQASKDMKKVTPKLLTKVVKVKHSLTKSFASKITASRTPQPVVVKATSQKKLPAAKVPVKSLGTISKHVDAAPRKISPPRKIEGMVATKMSVPKSLKREELAKNEVAMSSSKTSATKKETVHSKVDPPVEAPVRKSEDLAHEKELEAEVAALQAKLKLAATNARKEKDETKNQVRRISDTKAMLSRKDEERAAAKIADAIKEEVQTTVAPVVATAAPEKKATVAPVAAAASDSNDSEMTMTMVPTGVPAATQVVQASQDTQVSFFGSIFHWFHNLFFGPDPLPVVTTPTHKLQQPDPNEGRPPFTRQNVENTAMAAHNDGLADMAIGDEWSRKEKEDISLLDQVKREDRALRLDAETPKKSALPAASAVDAERSGSTHISNFWQTLADEDADIETALTENGDDLEEYERLKKLQDAKVVASVSEINSQLGEHSSLGRRSMHLRKGVAAA